ncbi:hypothetical protein MBLNU459_g2744t1 [Dothideomycetes sp. NU459]
MPTYLLHGFRWPRPLVRIHIILQNIDDAAAEWLVAQGTTAALIENFEELWPDAMSHLPNLRFIEQYDPNDLRASAASQPFAYVADVVEEVTLGLDVDEVRGKGVGNEQWGALMEIRDKLAPDEKVGWYVVVCGDEERWAPPTVDLLRGGVPREGFNGVQTNEPPMAQQPSETASSASSDAIRSASRSDTLAGGVSGMTLEQRPANNPPPEPVKKEKGVKKWFGSGSLSRRKR